jgi:hypothetical protein
LSSGFDRGGRFTLGGGDGDSAASASIGSIPAPTAATSIGIGTIDIGDNAIGAEGAAVGEAMAVLLGGKPPDVGALAPLTLY